MKSVWPIVWTIVAVIVCVETGLLYSSGRLPAMLSFVTGAQTPAPSIAARPGELDLPVHVMTPPSRGDILPQLQNASTNEMALRVTAMRPGTNQQREWVIALKPNQTRPLARRDEWTFIPGDELNLVSDGYRPRKVRLQ